MNLLAEMSWEEVKEYLERDNRVILPLGAAEEHGRHLGLGTDFIEAEAIARGAGEETNVAVAPTLNYWRICSDRCTATAFDARS